MRMNQVIIYVQQVKIGPSCPYLLPKYLLAKYVPALLSHYYNFIISRPAYKLSKEKVEKNYTCFIISFLGPSQITSFLRILLYQTKFGL